MKQIQEQKLTKTIVITETNYKKLESLGAMHESFNDVLSKLLGHIEVEN